jgi:hypothetical protein
MEYVHYLGFLMGTYFVVVGMVPLPLCEERTYPGKLSTV